MSTFSVSINISKSSRVTNVSGDERNSLNDMMMHQLLNSQIYSYERVKFMENVAHQQLGPLSLQTDKQHNGNSEFTNKLWL